MTYLDARWPSSDKRSVSSKTSHHIGTLRHDIRSNLRAIPAAGKGVICFTVDDERRTVLIIAITYAGADWSSRVAERN